MPSAAMVANLFETAVKTASVEDAAYPIANISDRISAKPFGFGITTGGDLDCDLGAATDFDTLALINHNFSSGVTVQVKADNTSPPTTIRATMVYRAGSMWVDLGSLSFRYVRLTVTDTAAENLIIGEAVLGNRILLPRASRYGTIPGKMRRQILHETVRGAIHSYQLWEKEIREYTWRVLASEMTNFETVNNSVYGRLLPLVWIPDTSGVEVIYARLLDMDFRPEELENILAYDISWRLQSESYGLEVTV